METLVGTTLGGYVLTHLLGSGGMGAVYLAEDRTIGQQVAIKIVHTESDNDSGSASGGQSTERFKQEARAVASLDHLHILPLYRYGEEMTTWGRRAYMIMQYRPEGSLWDWLHLRAEAARGQNKKPVPYLPQGQHQLWPLGPEEVADYLQQAASALQYAHDRGIAHRDIKPANFLLRVDNTATNNKIFLLLSDFGLAKFYTSNSATSHILGTPTYMAPEQFHGIAGPEADQYALGVMVYYLLAGRPPFEGDPMRLMHQHLNTSAPSIRAFVPNIAQDVEQVLQRALAKQPEQRFPSVTALAESFTQAISSSFNQTVVTNSVYPQRSNPSNSGLSNTFTEHSAPTIHESLLPSDLAFERSRPSLVRALPNTPTPSSRPAYNEASGWNSQPALPQEQFTSLPSYPPNTVLPSSTKRRGRRSALAWIVAGAAVAVAGTSAGAYYVSGLRRPTTVQQPAQNNTTTNMNPPAFQLLEGHQGAVISLAWAPDGTLLASGSDDHTARLWSVQNRASRLTFNGHNQAVQSIAWKPDSTLLASGSKNRQVIVWNTQGTKSLSFTLDSAVNALTWTPDGERIFAATQEKTLNEISVERKRFITHRILTTPIHAVSVSPNGTAIALGSEAGNIAIIPLPIPRKILPGSIHHIHTGTVNTLAWSGDGTQIASSSTDGKLNIISAPIGKILHTFDHKGAVIHGLAWDPTGARRVATASSDGVLRIWNIDEGTHNDFSGRHGALTSLSWSSSGLTTGTADAKILLWSV